MASKNPQEYYEDPSNHGTYVYVNLEQMVLNFIANYTGDGTILGKAKRSQIIYQFKQGIKKFSTNALREVKAVELELGDTLDIILPPDYVNYARISFVNEDTGELMELSRNTKVPLATAYLQDHNADILFDDNGFVLEGSTLLSLITDDVNHRTIQQNNLYDFNNAVLRPYGNIYNEKNYKLDPTQNANGTFNIDTRSGKIHFSSNNASRVLMLEYISDGLEYSNESDIKVTKLAEIALYNYVNYNLMVPMSPMKVPMYEKNAARKAWEAEYRNAKIALMDIKLSDVSLCLNGKRQWFK
jgi:hypothetical protein